MPGAALIGIKAGSAAALGLAAILLVGCAPDASETQPDLPFDFYVLALSWSPTYCALEGERANRTQCEEIRPDGFVVHGLWPQFEKGWPEFCPSDEPERVPDVIVGQMIDLMPSGGLVGHQWRKHGSCSGLTQRAYFEAVRTAFAAVVVPNQFNALDGSLELSAQDAETAFIEVNPGLSGDSIAISCSGGLLREVRICLNAESQFRPCPEVDQRGCQARNLTLPARE